MNKSILCLILTLTLASCFDTGKRHVTPIWSGYWSQQELLGLKGDVQELNSYLSDGVTTDNPDTPENESRVHFMTQKFNSGGQLEYYNTTTTEPTPQPESRIDIEFAAKMAYYYYKYDTQGRISSVKMYDIGKYGPGAPFTYIITYGDHEKYIPVPFSVGGLSIYLIKGITSITSETNIPNTSYSLTYDGESVESNEIGGGWENPPKKSVYTFNNKFPHTITTYASMDGQPIWTKVEEYSWDVKGVLGTLTVTTTPAGAANEIEVVKEHIKYSDKYPLKPLNHVWWLNGVQDASFIYQYNDKGLAIRGAYITSADYPHKGSYTPTPFTWIYEEYDDDDNWIIKVEPKTSEDDNSNVNYKNRWTREFKYF